MGKSVSFYYVLICVIQAIWLYAFTINTNNLYIWNISFWA